MLHAEIEKDDLYAGLIDQRLAAVKMITVAAHHKQAFQSLNELEQHLCARTKSIQALPPTDDASQ